MRAAERWEQALAGWAIPDAILEQAPESPWEYPTALFRVTDRPEQARSDSAATRAALEVLGPGGSVLDVGCGGGSASLALVPPAATVIGVDPSTGMLAAFAAAADAAGVAHHGHEGTWPEVADSVPHADVAVCHHVAYNVGDITPFVAALADHGRLRVVLEVTARHPLAGLAPLWQEFWDLEQPSEPTADLLVDVVRDLGYPPIVSRAYRPQRKFDPDSAAYVAFVRRRMCLGADRDREVAAALRRLPSSPTELVTIAFDTST